MEWYTGLNEHQKAAANQIDGTELILAGAGSGKTKTMVNRICHMLQSGISANEILGITFTNKAAKEMKDRVITLLDNRYPAPMLCTFHSFGYQIIKRFGYLLGFRNHIGISDEDDSKKRIIHELKDLSDTDFDSLFKEAENASADKTYMDILKEMRFITNGRFKTPEDKTVNDFSKDKDLVSSVISFISKQKDLLVLPEDLKFSPEDLSDDDILCISCFIYGRYEAEKLKENVVDFDDLIEKAAHLLMMDVPADYYHNEFKYIMVDEYQDTSRAQDIMISILSAQSHNLCVVGDDYQSIYAFRGALVDNIINFPDNHPGCTVYTLGENYRSTKNIVDGSYEVILNNKKQAQKEVFSVNETGNKILIREFEYGNQESVQTIREIADKIDAGEDPSDFAILYRNNATSRLFEQELLKRDIPYKIFGGTPFFSRKEVKDTISFIKMAADYYDTTAFERIVNIPKRGIGPKTLKPLIDDIENSQELLIDRLARYSESHPKFEKLADEMSAIRKTAKTGSITDLTKEIRETFMTDDYLLDISDSAKPDDFLNRQQNVEEVASYAKEFETIFYKDNSDASKEDALDAFLEGVALITDQDSEKSGDYVTLMTMHKSKGLEFKNVYIVACEYEPRIYEGTPEEIEFNVEEARRLFYVAMTRAKKSLTISNAQTRMVFGQRKQQRPSPFIEEIPDKNCARKTLARPRQEFQPWNGRPQYASSYSCQSNYDEER